MRQQMEDLEQAIAERLPPGSSVEEVEVFLAERDLDYTTSRSRGAGSTIRKHDPALADRTVYVTSAAIRDVYDAVLLKKSIYPRFYFDDDKKRLWSTVEVIADGL